MNKMRKYSGIRLSILLPAVFSCLPLFSEAQSSEFNYSTGNVKGKNYVGGLIGGISGKGSILRNSFARGSVTGRSDVGGLAGTSDGAVIYSYSTGNVTGDTRTGGLLGSCSGTVTSSYWDTQTSGQSNSAGGTPRTTDPLTYPYSPTVYSGWDFTSVWKADTDPAQNSGYPFLQPSAVYLVSVQVYPPGVGTATGSGYCMANGQVQLTAIPGNNYTFKGWEKNGAVIATKAQFTMTVTENTGLIARFESKTTSVIPVPVQRPSGIKIYPNPVTETLWVDFSMFSDRINMVQIVNPNGQIMKSFCMAEEGNVRKSFPVSDLRPGIYLIIVRGNLSRETGRFVKF